jgi:hypothetical protein
MEPAPIKITFTVRNPDFLEAIALVLAHSDIQNLAAYDTFKRITTLTHSTDLQATLQLIPSVNIVNMNLGAPQRHTRLSD